MTCCILGIHHISLQSHIHGQCYVCKRRKDHKISPPYFPATVWCHLNAKIINVLYKEVGRSFSSGPRHFLFATTNPGTCEHNPRLIMSSVLLGQLYQPLALRSRKYKMCYHDGSHSNKNAELPIITTYT